MQSLTAHGLSYLAFDRLANQPRLRHGVSLRRQSDPLSSDPAGVIEFDFSSRDPSRFRAHVARFCQALELAEHNAVVASQVHGVSVAVIEQPGEAIPAADALCTRLTDVPLMLRGADCPLVLVYDPEVPAVGLAHAGWRGTVQKIVVGLIDTMGKQFNSRPGRMIAGIGPGICGGCYQVGPEVIRIARENLSDAEKLISPSDNQTEKDHPDSGYFNLFEANRQQLLQAGLSDENIEMSHLCTYEDSEKFYSYRREGDAAGRWALLAGIL